MNRSGNAGKPYWLRGVDGSTWDIINGPAVLTDAGLEGPFSPAYEVRARRTAGRDGSVATGSNVLERDVMLPLVLAADGGPDEFRALYGALSRAFSPDADCELLTLAGDDLLALRCRLTGAPQRASIDPLGAQVFEGLWELVAHDPYWYLPTVSLEFASASAAPVSYYPGYPFRRTAGRQAGRVRVDNPGTEPVPWVARFPSPSAGFALTIDGHRVAGTIPVPEGSFLELDSKATAAYLVRGGTRTHIPWGQLESFDWAQLQPGTASEVQITNQGAGIPSLTFRPKRREAL